MTINEAQRQEMLIAAKPLMEWLNNNCHPHCEVVVGVCTVAVQEVLATNGTEEFLHD